jgi:hypothetical protein
MRIFNGSVALAFWAGDGQEGIGVDNFSTYAHQRILLDCLRRVAVYGFRDRINFGCILESLEHRLSGILRTIATDEDSVFVCSMTKFHLDHPEIGHRLCVP